MMRCGADRCRLAAERARGRGAAAAQVRARRAPLPGGPHLLHGRPRTPLATPARRSRRAPATEGARTDGGPRAMLATPGMRGGGGDGGEQVSYAGALRLVRARARKSERGPCAVPGRDMRAPVPPILVARWLTRQAAAWGRRARASGCGCWRRRPSATRRCSSASWRRRATARR
eukprot:scaffold1333_cov274-Prasinococcus_capsulatus_cf.AAC.5